MLNIWSDVVKSAKEWQLYIFGNGDKSELEKKMESLGLSDTVHLMPATKRIGDEYDKSSLFALSSRYEGLPMVLLQAMSHGLPVVSFACPCGPKDVIHPNFGTIVDNGDIKGFANSMIGWMNDLERLNEGSKNAYDAVHDYTKDKLMEKWDALFKSLTLKHE